MLKVALVVGTRPEAIKMAPIAIELAGQRGMKPLLVLTAQHRSMCDDVFEVFGLKPDYDLDIMKPDQTLFEVTARLARKLESVLAKERPDVVVVSSPPAWLVLLLSADSRRSCRGRFENRQEVQPLSRGDKQKAHHSHSRFPFRADTGRQASPDR